MFDKKKYMDKWRKEHKEQIKISRDKWNNSHKEYYRKYAKQYAQKHPKQIFLYLKKWYKDNPWYSHWQLAKRRCLPGGDYYPRVTFSLTVNDIKYLWFRDKAYLMKQPSIDRINNGNYIKTDCRFIEMLENARLGSMQYAMDCKKKKLN